MPRIVMIILVLIGTASPSIGFATNQDDDPIAKITKVIQADPSNAKNYVRRAMLYQVQKDQVLALVDYDKALRLDPNYVEAYHNRAVVYEIMGRPEKAIEDFTKAIELRPMDKTYCARGVSYTDKGEIDNAIKDYTKAIELNPRNLLAYSYRAFAYYDKKEYEKSWNIEGSNPSLTTSTLS